MKDMKFMWCPNANYMDIIENIFRKSKRIRKLDPEDIVGKKCINIVFKVEGSESPYFFCSCKFCCSGSEGFTKPSIFCSN
jgi:hypothetical protein